MIEQTLIARLEEGRAYASAEAFYEEILSEAIGNSALNDYRRFRDSAFIDRLQAKYADKWR